MRKKTEQDRDAIRRVLAAAGRDSDAAVDSLFDLLRDGAGEEPLVESLARLDDELGLTPGEPGALVLLARDLLRIGVRPRASGWRRRRLGPDVCTICEREVPFCWSCTCPFRICQDCLEENRWGMTCNNITWECPDCGKMRSF